MLQMHNNSCNYLLAECAKTARKVYRRARIRCATRRACYSSGRPCLRLGPLGARLASRTTAWLDSENSDPYAGGYSKERAPAHHEKSRSTWLRLPRSEEHT